MKEMKTKFNKILVILIVFMILFSNFGTTLVIAAENDVFEVINKGLFQKEEINFDAYFENQDCKRVKKIVDDVNHKVKLMIDIEPNLEGYLKEGEIKLTSENDINFKITSVNGIVDQTLEEIEQEKLAPIQEVETDSQESLLDLNSLDKINEDVDLKNPDELKNELLKAMSMPENSSDNNLEENEKSLINEDEYFEEKIEEYVNVNDNSNDLELDVKKVSNNEVFISNIVKETNIIIELEYDQKENLNIEDLNKDFKVQLSGTFINKDLEEVKIGKEKELTIGWTYSKEFDLKSDYTKFSPFELEDIKGTIVENKIIVDRTILDKNYLPVKQLNLKIKVPLVNNKKPLEVDLIANQLMATRGEEVGKVTFSSENWNYDEEKGIISVNVNNDNLVNTQGFDEYVVIYRYEDYIDEEHKDLDKVVKAEIEEFSANKNNIVSKEINEVQKIKADVGELITYGISSPDEKINKGKIYANYNSNENSYETEFRTQVNVNILTSDVLEELKIDSLNEYYNTYTHNILLADGIINKRIRFNYNEIKNLLSKGGEIVITNENNEVLYNINNDVINSQEDCEINLRDSKGIIIYVRNISENGNLNFELVKAIKNCDLDKVVFKDVENIQTILQAQVKYANIEQTMKIDPIGVKIPFEESVSNATLTINNKDLSTLEKNSNIELKIQLNNASEESDLYVNPVFELVFPKYVKNVSVESINLLYEEGLKVKDFKTYTEGENVKMRIELEGVQSKFPSSDITNGTNIIVNVDVDVDSYTPAKEDQIKLYYINEGVSTYQTQTKWKISKTIPDGILNITNGFDAEIIRYNAPVGVIPVNGILNYDGHLSEVKSVKQGNVTRQVEMNDTIRVAKMELLALNNTPNDVSNLVLLGRVPFKGNKDIITGNDCGTNVDTIVRDLIKADINNSNMVDIYYSTNPNANKNIEDGSNGWSKEVQDISSIKSYLIIVNGNLKSGQVLKFTYDFEIPEKLPYDTNIQGTFGIYYDNVENDTLINQSASADKVSLITEPGPKLEATLDVIPGNGTKVNAGQRLKYVVKVKNIGSVVAEDVSSQAKIPEYSTYVFKSSSTQYGDYGYLFNPEKKVVDLKFGTINPGETKELAYEVRVDNKPRLDQYAKYKDEKGYYNRVVTGFKDVVKIDEKTGKEITVKEAIFENQYITEVPEIFVKNKVIINVPLLSGTIETNEVANSLTECNFLSDISLDYDRVLHVNQESNFRVEIKNVSTKKLENVKVAFDAGKIYEYISSQLDKQDYKAEYNVEDGKIYFDVGNFEPDSKKIIDLKVKAKNIENGEESNDCRFEYYVEGHDVEKSTIIPQKVAKSLAEAKDVTTDLPKEIKENEKVVISTEVKNIGKALMNKGYLEFKFPDSVSLQNAVIDNKASLSIEENRKGYVKYRLPELDADESMVVKITLGALNQPGKENSVVTLERIINNENQNDIKLDDISFDIINSEMTEEEKEQDRIDKIKEEEKHKNDKEDSIQNEENNKPGNNPNNTPGKEDNVNNKPENNKPNNNNNNSNGNSNNSVNNNSVNKPNDEINHKVPKFTISGKAWIDENKNGVMEDSEKQLSNIKVFLLTMDNRMLKSTMTSSSGDYRFDNIEPGKYVIGFIFDNEKYELTTYMKKETSAMVDSDVIESKIETVNAVTDEIVISDKNIEGINIGLIKKDEFDLCINKYLKKINVQTRKGNKSYDYDNETLSKVEIHSKEINKAKIELEYNIVLENKGVIEGYAIEVKDIVPEGMIFEEDLNKDWYKDKEENIYLKDIKNVLIKPGEKKEYTLVLSKEINPENIGAISNKAIISKTGSKENIVENKENNSAVQTTLVVVSTGRTVQYISLIIILTILVILTFVFKNKKTIFKNQKPFRINTKRIYK